MTTKTYTRPSGTTITVNDTVETRELAESQGWKAKAKPKTKAKAKPKKAI